MKSLTDGRLEEQIGQWRAYVSRRRDPQAPALEELERRLRDHLAALTQAGLAEQEAFLVSLRRMSALDRATREYARTHAAGLWSQSLPAPDAAEVADRAARREMFVALALAAAAAAVIKIPALFGLPLSDTHAPFYLRNASLFVFPLLTFYFVWQRRWEPGRALWLGLPFAAGAVFVNVYPFRPGGDTWVLAALHLPIALWLVVGFAYTGGRWFADGGRMDFVRFSGELFIYYVLIALGGGVLTGLTAMLFKAIGRNPERFINAWLIPCGAMGAVIIGSWLVETRQGVAENIAPVLTRIFTPLFTALLLVFLAIVVWTGSPIHVERQVLIGFDLLLVLIVGLVLYAASARDPEAPPGLFDGLQLVLVLSALAVDGVALAAVAARISEFGFTPNRVAALAENLILLVNLAWSAWLYARFLRRRVPFAALERWQIAYLPVYAVWAALVVVIFPPVFGYR